MKNKIQFKRIAFVSALFLSQIFTAQYVGINTTTPEKELDINGELKVRTIKEETTITGDEKILIVHKNEKVIKEIDPSLINPAGSTAFSAQNYSGFTVLGLEISIGENWKIVPYTIANTKISSSYFNYTDNTFTIPSTGIYKIGYYFRVGDGLQATVLGSLKMGIIKTSGAVSSLLDSRSYPGINIGLGSLLPVLQLSITESTIDNIYFLQAGDKISFAITDGGLLNLTLLGSSATSAYVYKVSN